MDLRDFHNRLRIMIGIDRDELEAAGVIVRGVKAENKRIRLLHARDCTLDGIDLKNGEFIVEGQPDPAATQPAHDAPTSDLAIRNLHIDNGYLDLRDCTGLTS